MSDGSTSSAVGGMGRSVCESIETHRSVRLSCTGTIADAILLQHFRRKITILLYWPAICPSAANVSGIDILPSLCWRHDTSFPRFCFASVRNPAGGNTCAGGLQITVTSAIPLAKSTSTLYRIHLNLHVSIHGEAVTSEQQDSKRKIIKLTLQ